MNRTRRGARPAVDGRNPVYSVPFLCLSSRFLLKSTRLSRSMAGTKRSATAYFFAFIGGLFGFHHLYLGRTQHALLWFTTFGGFGIGVLYEILFLMKNYVREANQDQLAVDRYQRKLREQKSPAFELIRFCGKRSKTFRLHS